MNRRILVQLLYTISVGLPVIICGMNISWLAGGIPRLLDGEPGYSVTPSEGSWIGSIGSVGIIIGSFYLKLVMDVLGRKWTLLSTGVTYIICLVLLVYSKNAWHILVARSFSGVGTGVCGSIAAIYVGEISESHIRGSMNTITKFMFNLGMFIGYVIGPFLPFFTTLYIYIAATLVTYTISACIFPESPYFYVKNGKFDEAAKALAKLRAVKDTKLVEEELESIKNNVSDDMKNRSTFMELFKNPIYRKSLFIFTALQVLQHMTGFYTVGIYVQTIFEAASTGISASMASIIYGGMQVFAVLSATYTVDKFGRKPLLTMSLVGITLSTTVIGVYFYMQDQLHMDVETMESISWIPVTSVVVFCFTYSIGLGPISFILEGELFPLNVKGAAVSFGIIIGGIVSMFATKIYQIVSDGVGVSYGFWMFGAFAAIGLLLPLYMPETKNKTFSEIQDSLNQKKI